MRYLVCYIEPETGREPLGSSNQFLMTYANVRNVIKFGLAKEGLKPGQYNIYLWFGNGREPRFVCKGWKRVPKPVEGGE